MENEKFEGEFNAEKELGMEGKEGENIENQRENERFFSAEHVDKNENREVHSGYRLVNVHCIHYLSGQSLKNHHCAFKKLRWIAVETVVFWRSVANALHRKHALFQFILCYCTPLVLIAYFYTKLLSKLREHTRTFKVSLSCATSPHLTSSPEFPDPVPAHLAVHARRRVLLFLVLDAVLDGYRIRSLPGELGEFEQRSARFRLHYVLYSCPSVH